MEASFLRRKLLTPAELRSLSERSDLRGAMQMASHMGAIVVVAVLHGFAMGSGWVLLTGLALGVLLNFLYLVFFRLKLCTPTHKTGDTNGKPLCGL